MALETLILVHFAASAYLAGLIWVIQIVHYPMLGALDPQTAAAACGRHSRAITPIVAPAMLIEVVTALMMLPPFGIVPAVAGLMPWLWVSFGLVVVVWISTFAVQVPLHARLQRQAPGSIDGAAVRWLVRSNWIRTACWSARALLAGWLVWELIQPAAMKG